MTASSFEIAGLQARISDLERKVAELDARTIGAVRLGPRRPTEDETTAQAKATASTLANAIAKLKPVDRSNQVLTTGAPVPPDRSHTEIESATGMQKGYVVLSAEERGQGFVRPFRDSYVHVGVGGSEIDPSDRSKLGLKGNGCGALTRMGRAIAETYARDPGFYTGTFCVGCKAHFPLEEFVWADTDERVGS